MNARTMAPGEQSMAWRLASDFMESRVAMGGLLLLHNLGLFSFAWIAKMWPLLMIAAGVVLLRGSLFGSRQ